MAEIRVKSTGTIKLFENDNTSSVTIASPASLSSNRTVTLPDGDVTLVAGTMLTSGGKIGQVLQATKTDTTSTTSTSFVDVTGMTIDITPAATASKILVLVNANMCGSAADWFGHMKLVRDSTDLFIGDAASNRQRDSALWRSKTEQNLRNLTPMYLDSPSSTSATTYKLQWAVESGMTFYLNRTGADSDTTAYGRTASSITVMEGLA